MTVGIAKLACVYCNHKTTDDIKQLNCDECGYDHAKQMSYAWAHHSRKFIHNILDKCVLYMKTYRATRLSSTAIRSYIENEIRSKKAFLDADRVYNEVLELLKQRGIPVKHSV